MASDSNYGCGGWISTFIFTVIVVVIAAGVRTCFFTKHDDPSDVTYTTGEIYHVGKFRSQPTQVYFVYKIQNIIYCKQENSDRFGDEWKEGSNTIKVPVAYSISSPELCELIEEIELPDMYHIGMKVDEKLVHDKLGTTDNEKVNFDTWAKAKVDSFCIHNYWKVLKEAKK